MWILNQLGNLETVCLAAAGTGIEAKAIRYGANDILVKNYDPALAQKEFEIFNLTGQIVSDDEAKR